MFKFIKQVGNYAKHTVQAAQYIRGCLLPSTTCSDNQPITVQYPYEKLIPSERFRGRIHFEFDKCISCEVCVRVCPINLPIVDWEFDKVMKKVQERLVWDALTLCARTSPRFFPLSKKRCKLLEDSPT